MLLVFLFLLSVDFYIFLDLGAFRNCGLAKILCQAQREYCKFKIEIHTDISETQGRWSSISFTKSRGVQILLKKLSQK